MNSLTWKLASFSLSGGRRPNAGRAVAVLISILALVSVGHAATIAGTVTGPDSEPFKGAFVQAQNLKTKITVMVLSNKDGQYRIENPAGRQLRRAD